MLKRLRIGPKLLLAPGLVLMLLVLVAAGAWYGMVRQNASLENMVQVRAARLKAAADIAGDAKHAHANIYQLLAWTNGSFAKARLDRLTADIKRKHAAIALQLGELAQATGGAERGLIDGSADALASYRKGVAETIEMAQMDQSIATNSMEKAERAFGLLTTRLGQLAALEKSLSEEAYTGAKDDYVNLVAAMGALVLLSIVLSLWATMLVRRAMLADIRLISDVVGDLADGRLAAGKPAQGRDEIADASRALSHTIATLNRSMRAVLDSVRSIDCASHEIATGNLDLSNRTERQAASLEETASAMEALTLAVKANAGSARMATELAASAASLADSGGKAVERAVQTMEQIKGSSRKIVDIIAVIDSISFQTNILALNAAVEAARAGEQGRGFAVVAAEVRILAQRSAAAAKEIKTLITASVTQIDGGSASVNEAGSSMGTIVASVRQVNDIIERISSASSEQAEGIAEVNHAVGQMDAMTQQNAALVEQAAAAAESLHEQTVNLSQAVAIFKIDYEGDGEGQADAGQGQGQGQNHNRPAPALHGDPDAAFRRMPERGQAGERRTRDNPMRPMEGSRKAPAPARVGLRRGS